MRLALVAKTNSQEDVCGICTMWLLVILEALSKNGAIIYTWSHSQLLPSCKEHFFFLNL